MNRYQPNHTTYSDNRPAPPWRFEAEDQGIVLRHGFGPEGCDERGAREAIICEENGLYHLFYDGASKEGWRACLATSSDLVNWERRGPILDFGAEGEMDSAAATSPWVVRENGEWHMFYLGTPNGREVPAFPYLTLKAKSHSLSGPWKKQPEVIPFRTKPGTFYSQTASPGHITQSGEDYVQIFSSTNDPSPNLPFGQRTLGMARTRNLNGEWEVEQSPILPVSEQIENSSLYFEESIGVWFLLTNHIGIDEVEFTDAVWMYWSDDLHHWSPDNKAVVLDGKNCTWASRCIGMPSVIRVKDRLAVFYDAPGGDSIEPLHRDIGLAWLDLPLSIPSEATTPAKRDLA